MKLPGKVFPERLFYKPAWFAPSNLGGHMFYPHASVVLHYKPGNSALLPYFREYHRANFCFLPSSYAYEAANGGET